MKHFSSKARGYLVFGGVTIYSLLTCLSLISCADNSKAYQEDHVNVEQSLQKLNETAPYIVVLGNVQDAGSPQAACEKECCKLLWNKPDPTRKVSCLGLVDPESGKRYVFDATPDITAQLHDLSVLAAGGTDLPDGVFLTHAHVGHYTGLMQFGKEAIGAHEVPVYAMPRMDSFLKTDGPWSQLVELNNIQLKSLKREEPVQLAGQLTVTPFRVPHRDEYSETVGYKIQGPNRSALFIPDIDKWTKWEKQLATELAQVDYAFLDGTFFDQAELPGRDMGEIPHPFVIETMAALDNLASTEKAKVHFIHFNHTNALLDTLSSQYQRVIESGYQVADYLDIMRL